MGQKLQWGAEVAGMGQRLQGGEETAGLGREERMCLLQLEQSSGMGWRGTTALDCGFSVRVAAAETTHEPTSPGPKELDGRLGANSAADCLASQLGNCQASVALGRLTL